MIVQPGDRLTDCGIVDEPQLCRGIRCGGCTAGPGLSRLRLASGVVQEQREARLHVAWRAGKGGVERALEFGDLYQIRLLAPLGDCSWRGTQLSREFLIGL